MATIVLVPGAGLGAWAWSRVTPGLRAAGHDVRPLTLTGNGDRAHLADASIDLSTWVTDVVAHLETEELAAVVLVGHSFSGAVITGVAERVPERLARLVYLDAVVARDGRSAFDEMGPQMAGFFESLVAAHDGWSLPWLSDELLAQHYAGHGISAADLAWMRRHLTAQPIGTYREALALRSAAAAALPRTFIQCTENAGSAGLGPNGPGWDMAEIAAGHWPMITAPAETVRVLDAVARSA